MDMEVEEMRDGNRRDVGRRRWRNGLEERRWTSQILTGNNYKHEGVSSLRDIRNGRQGQRQRQRHIIMVAQIWDNRDCYGGGGDAGWQQKRCGMTEMAKWARRTAVDWENTDRE